MHLGIRLIWPALLALQTVALSAAPAWSATKVSFGQVSPTATVWPGVVATKKGFFAANGVEIDTVSIGVSPGMQAVAAGWHHKSAEQLRKLADEVGRERICVMHGTEDRMITYHHAEVLRRELGEGIRFERFEGRGHVLMWEEREVFNRVVEEMVQKGEKLRG